MTTDLATAVRLGERLVADAVWLDNRCNWVGAQPADRRDVTSRLVYRALGPTLYAGSSGVALFLAQLSMTAGGDEFRPTALAAARHAVSRYEDIAPAARLGFYTGWSGLAAALLRVGLLLDSAEFVNAGTGLLQDVARLVAAVRRDGAVPAGGHEFDLTSGVAGAIPALALGYRVTHDDALAAAVADAAEWLADSADKRRRGWSWRSPSMRNQRNLTGLSHGAAGVAVAFLEAYRLTGDELFATGARNAMCYEDQWLDLDEGNWPDFREQQANSRTRTFVTLWCHGAPGIALSRLYAYEHLGEDQWRQDALTALSTTTSTVRRLVEAGGTDFSLCHGLTGTVECVQEAHRVLGAGVGGLDLPRLVAQHGLESYAQPGLAWPCGTRTEETPNLMLGLAGIGYFYLRLAAPDVPSILLATSWDLARDVGGETVPPLSRRNAATAAEPGPPPATNLKDQA
jgi:lantibiotic modifying enzyme